MLALVKARLGHSTGRLRGAAVARPVATSPAAAQGATPTTSPRSDAAGPPRTSSAERPFDVKLLEYLACPLTKKRLEYDATTNELVSRDIGVAYPIVRGIPRLVPTEGRILNSSTGSSASIKGR